jgi:hypothetical protein
MAALAARKATYPGRTEPRPLVAQEDSYVFSDRPSSALMVSAVVSMIGRK